MISKGSKSKEPYINLGNITQADIAAYYFKIKSIPALIHSPLRRDNKPSFALYCPKDTSINYKDFSTGESGNIWNLLAKMWNCTIAEAVKKVCNDINNKADINISNNTFKKHYTINRHIDLQCKVREWQDYDLKYWGSYGISLKWLKYADVYPISHKIVIKDNISYAFKADKYAYAYVEFKEGRTTLKIYQPFNKYGFKWSNRHDRSVISLWTKVPKYGDKICICSSLKDALCLWANVGIPSIAIQGEGYSISNTAINELKRRFKQIYICLDNDEVGLKDAISLAKQTGFINIVLPQFEGGKDISDMRKSLGKEKFNQIILNLFK